MFGNYVTSTARAHLTRNKLKLLLGSWSQYVFVTLNKLKDIVLAHLLEEPHVGTIVSVEGRGQR